VELTGTPEQQLVFLNLHWGRRYEFALPQAPNGKWTATDKFGDHAELQASSATELLEAVRTHYYNHYLPHRRDDDQPG
jgi:hypothetical protein